MLFGGLFLLFLACASPQEQPTPAPLKEFTSDAYTIQIPVGWNARNERLGGPNIDGKSLGTRFVDPDNADVELNVVAVRYRPSVGEEYTSDFIADSFLDGMREMMADGDVEVVKRETAGEGAVNMKILFGGGSFCDSTALVRVQVIRSQAYIVQAAACSNDFDSYSTVLQASFDSFRPNP